MPTSTGFGVVRENQTITPAPQPRGGPANSSRSTEDPRFASSALSQAVERVWRAVTEPAELGRWFLAPIDWTPALADTFTAFGEQGTVSGLTPPHLLAWEGAGSCSRSN